MSLPYSYLHQCPDGALVCNDSEQDGHPYAWTLAEGGTFEMSLPAHQGLRARARVLDFAFVAPLSMLNLHSVSIRHDKEPES